MKKLIQGIVDFRKNVLPEYRATFAKLALGQSPDALLIACSDSRVVPNLFASTNPGDLFVVRNVGNIIPACGADGKSVADESEAAAIEFALHTLRVRDVIVCGHSECGAVGALMAGRKTISSPNLRQWLRHAEGVLSEKAGERILEGPKERHNLASQLNVLSQLDHVRTYPLVRKRVEEGSLGLHAWWFELSTASVYAYEEAEKRFILIDEAEAARILKMLR